MGCGSSTEAPVANAAPVEYTQKKNAEAKITAVDTHNFVNAKKAFVGQTGQFADMRFHVLMKDNATYHDELLLGMRGTKLGNYSSGQHVTSKDGRKGKLSIAVGTADDKKFLIYWADGTQGYISPRDIQPEVPKEDGDWNEGYIKEQTGLIKAVEAKGGLKKLMQEDGKLRHYVAAVENNAGLAADVYNGASDSVKNHPIYPSFIKLADALIAHIADSQKPLQASVFANQPLTLFQDAKKCKPLFDAQAKQLATMTKGTLMTAPLKACGRAVEKVLLDYAGNWCALTDIVRASIVYEDLAALYAAVELLSKTEKVGLTVLRVKNRLDFDKSQAAYRDFSMNVMLSTNSFHVCELQLHLKSYLEVKEKGGGHTAYGQARNIK